MKLLRAKHIFYIYIVSFLIIAGTILFALLNSENFEKKNHNYRDFSSEWYTEDGTPADLSEISGVIKVHTTLPQLQEDDILYLHAKTVNLTIYKADVCVYQTKVFNPRLFGYTPGAYYVQIPLDVSDSNKDITIVMDNPYHDGHGKIISIQLGNGMNILSDNVGGRIFSICISAIIIFIGLIFIFFFFPMWRKYTEGPQLLYFGLFAFCIGMFMLTDGKLLQELFQNAHIIHVISEMFMRLILIPLLLFFTTIYKNPPSCRKILLSVCIFSIVDFILSYTLSITGIMDYHQTIRLTHVAYILGISGFITCSVISFRYTKTLHPYTTAGIACICIGAISDILLWEYGLFMDSSFCTRIGALLFMCFEAIQLIDNFLIEYRKNIRSELLRKLAYQDGLTELLNRTSYIEALNEYKKTEPESVLIAFFDVNNLKPINDKYGHSSGDNLLILVARLLEKHFSAFSKCYRIGGDEFVIISLEKDAEQRFLAAESALATSITEINKEPAYPYDVSVASGYAVWNDKQKSLSDIVNEADENMYQHKKEMKERG